VLFNEVKKRVNLVFVVAAFSDRWLGENHVVDLLCRQSASRRISKRCLNVLKKPVDIVFVVAAFSAGWLSESHVADVLRGKPTAPRWRRHRVLRWRSHHALCLG
jgi:hypothetical protein